MTYWEADSKAKPLLALVVEAAMPHQAGLALPYVLDHL